MSTSDLPNDPRRSAAAFTLVESIVAMALLAIAGAAILYGVDGSLQATNASLEQMVATGLARQLMDEVVTAGIGASGIAAQVHSGSRKDCNQIGDFNLYRNQPPVDHWGVPLGQDDAELERSGTATAWRDPSFCAPTGAMAQWRQEVYIERVNEANQPMSPPRKGEYPDYLAIRVCIVKVDAAGVDRELASMRQVVAYVPPLP